MTTEKFLPLSIITRTGPEDIQVNIDKYTRKVSRVDGVLYLDQSVIAHDYARTIKFSMAKDLSFLLKNLEPMPKWMPDTLFGRNLYLWLNVANQYEALLEEETYVSYSRSQTHYAYSPFSYAEMLPAIEACVLQGANHSLGHVARGRRIQSAIRLRVASPESLICSSSLYRIRNSEGGNTGTDAEIPAPPEESGDWNPHSKRTPPWEPKWTAPKRKRLSKFDHVPVEKQRCLIEIRNKVKEPMPYQKTMADQVRAARVLADYNDLLTQTPIEVILPPKAPKAFQALISALTASLVPIEDKNGLRYDLRHQAHYKRIFSQGSTSKGGRFYAPIQNIESAIRRGIQLQGEPTAYLDFSCFHPTMIYHREGLTLEHDPYDLAYQARARAKEFKDYDPTVAAQAEAVANASRADAKKYFNVLLNSSSKEEAFASYRHEGLRISITGFSGSATPEDVLEEFKRRNPPFAKYLHSGVGLELQYEDSEIMLSIIEAALAQRIPIVAIHDGLLCPFSQRETMAAIMDAAYTSRFPNCRPTVKDAHDPSWRAKPIEAIAPPPPLPKPVLEAHVKAQVAEWLGLPDWYERCELWQFHNILRELNGPNREVKREHFRKYFQNLGVPLNVDRQIAVWVKDDNWRAKVDSKDLRILMRDVEFFRIHMVPESYTAARKDEDLWEKELDLRGRWRAYFEARALT